MTVATSPLCISLPEVLGSLLEDDGEQVRVVLRPDLRARTRTALAALCLTDAVAGSEALMIVPDDGEHLWFELDGWVRVAGLKPVRWRGAAGEAAARCLTFPSGGRLWTVCGRRPVLEDLPVDGPDVVRADGCERIGTDIVAAAGPRRGLRLLLLGALADVGHWFYQLAAGGRVSVRRLELDDVLTAFPDQEEAARRYDPALAARRLGLYDVPPKIVPPAPFGRFAISRLRIKTDKPMGVLHPLQRVAAQAQVGTPVVPFYLSPLQRRYLAFKRLTVSLGRLPRFVLLKYRRGGFTTLEQGLSYRMCATSPRSEVATLAHTRDSTTRIFRIAKLMADEDPAAVPLEGDSKTALEFANGSSFFIGTAGAKGFARGDTLRRAHGSEVAKWCLGPRQREQVEDLLAAVIGATSFGEVVLESTPNGREAFHRTYRDAKTGTNGFTPIFLPWFADPRNVSIPGTFDPEEVAETLTDKERDLIARHSLSTAQVAFRRDAKKTYGRLFVQEMPEDDETCFIASGVCYFDVDLLMSVSEALPEEEGEWKRHPGGYEVRWRPPEDGREYVAGCDTSEGLPGCDRSGVGVLDKRTGEQVASLHGLFSPRALADHAVRICRDYNNALLGIERENHGHAVILRVVEAGYRRPHFRGGPLYYFDRRQDLKSSRPGWTTNPQTRPVMLADLAEDVEQGGMIIHDRDFIDEACSFRLQPSGKFEADSGAHDDTVMKWAVAAQMRRVRRRKPRIVVG